MARRAGGIKIDISANVARLSADMTKAVGILGGFERQVNALSRNLKMALGGAIFAGAAYGLKELNKSVFELAEAGDKAGDISSAFEKLGGSSEAIKKATENTQGLVDKFDLMKAANEAMIRGLPNVNANFAQLADLAARVASARDLNPFETLQNLIGAISSGKATGLKEFGINIGEVKSKAEGTAKALSLLPEAIERLDPVTLGVADSVSAFKIQLSELYKEIGIGVDSSQSLAMAFQGFQTAADPELMRQFGAALANIEAIFISLASSALPTAINLVENFARGLDYLTGTSVTAKLVRQREEIENLKVSLGAQLQIAKGEGLGFFQGTETAKQAAKQRAQQLADQILNLEDDLQSKIAEERTKAVNLQNAQNEKALKSQEAFYKSNQTLKEKYGLGAKSDSQFIPDAINTTKLTRLTNDWARLTGDDLKQNIERAIDSVDIAAFENLKVEMYATTRDSFIAANQELVTARVATEEEIQRIAEKNAVETVQGYEARMHDAYDRLGEQLRQQHEAAVQSWSGFVDGLFNMDQFDPTAALKDLAKGFISEILAGFAGGLDQNAQSFYGIGRIIAQGFTDNAGEMLAGDPSRPSGAQSSGSGWSSIIQGIGSLFGGSSVGPSFSGVAQTPAQNAEWNAGAMEASGGGGTAQSTGAQGPMLSSSQAGAVIAAFQTAAVAFSAGKRDQQTQSNAGTGGAIGTGIGGTLGAIFGGPMGAVIGAQIGNIAGSMIGGLFKWGPQNPETQARHAFANFVEEGFKKLGTVSFFDAQRRLQTVSGQNFNFLEGSSNRFRPGGDNGGNWGDNFQKMGDRAVAAFSGIGQAMEEVLGLTEDVGDQIGYVLAVNLAGNVDNARLLVQQLGLDLNKMTDALVEAGRSGEMTWLQVEVAIQGVNDAFGEGLVAVGDVAGAFEELIGSGGRGVAALKGVRDLAIEALESGGRTLDDLRARLIAAGQAPEVVDTLIASIRGRGISSLEELKNANDRTLGGIVADTNAHSEVIKQQWEEMDGKIKGFQQTLKELDSQMTKDLTINIKTNFDGNTQQAMDQGVFSGTGAEKLRAGPIEKPNTKAAQFRRTVPGESQAKASSITLNVDARGAERGVHADVVSAMALMEKRIMTRTADLMYQQLRSSAA